MVVEIELEQKAISRNFLSIILSHDFLLNQPLALLEAEKNDSCENVSQLSTVMASMSHRALNPVVLCPWMHWRWALWLVFWTGLGEKTSYLPQCLELTSLNAIGQAVQCTPRQIVVDQTKGRPEVFSHNPVHKTSYWIVGRVGSRRVRTFGLGCLPTSCPWYSWGPQGVK